MNRAGREPAEDVKRRISAGCKQAGLKVSSARMYLRRSHCDRIIVVGASPPDAATERPMVTVLTTVHMSGDWSRTVDIRCCVNENNSILRFWDLPVMQGRDTVPVEDLAVQLCETLREREQVMAAIRLGIDGPYTFERSHWVKPSDLLYT